MSEIRSVCVFCGSNAGRDPSYLQAAHHAGRFLAEQKIDVIYGGGRAGLMGAVADAALAAGGKVIGVMPTSMVAREIAHTGLTQFHEVGSMHERKALMASLSDAFLALPGGFGTLDELFEIVTWALLGIHNKPCGLWNVNGYFDDLLVFLRHAVEEQLIRPAHAELLLTERQWQPLFDSMLQAVR